MDLRGRRESREGKLWVQRQEAAHSCIYCSTLFVEDLLCVAAIGTDLVPATRKGVTDKQTHRFDDIW